MLARQTFPRENAERQMEQVARRRLRQSASSASQALQRPFRARDLGHGLAREELALLINQAGLAAVNPETGAVWQMAERSRRSRPAASSALRARLWMDQ